MMPLYTSTEANAPGQLIRSDEDLRAYLNCISHFHPVTTGPVRAEKSPQSLPLRVGIPHIQLAEISIDPHAIGILSGDVSRKYTVLPILIYENQLVVAMEDPAAIEIINILQFLTGHAIEPVMANKDDISNAIEKYYGVGNVLDSLSAAEGGKSPDEEQEDSLHEVERQAMEKPIVRFVSGILIEAIRKRRYRCFQ